MIRIHFKRTYMDFKFSDRNNESNLVWASSRFEYEIVSKAQTGKLTLQVISGGMSKCFVLLDHEENI